MDQHQMLHNTPNATGQQVVAVKIEIDNETMPCGYAISSIAKTVSQNEPFIKLEYESELSRGLSSSANVSITNGHPSSLAPAPSCIKHESDEFKCSECEGEELVKDEPADDAEKSVKQETEEEMRLDAQTEAANVSITNGRPSRLAYPAPSCIKHESDEFKCAECIDEKLIKDEPESESNMQQTNSANHSTNGPYTAVTLACIKHESEEYYCTECEGEELIKSEPKDDAEKSVKQETEEEMRLDAQTEAANVPENLPLIKSEPDSDQDIQVVPLAGNSTTVPTPSDIKHEFDFDCAECEGEELFKIEPEETNESEDDAQMEPDTESLDQPEEELEDIRETHTSSEHDRQDAIDAAANDQPDQEEPAGPSQESNPPLQSSQSVSNITNVASTSNSRKSFLCDLCDKSFSTRHNLTKHIRTHTKEKPFKCTVCNKAFSQSGVLTIHQRLHTGDRPYQCSQCNKAFYTSSKLKQHERTHSGEKPHQCTECNKRFAEKGDLTKHLRTHSGSRPFPCPHCDYSASQSGNLKAHLRQHTDERPYSCTECTPNVSFRHKILLDRHMLRHNEERPHACNHCSKTFALPHDLKRHLAKVHSSKNL